jgi:hypothetical protein
VREPARPELNRAPVERACDLRLTCFLAPYSASDGRLLLFTAIDPAFLLLPIVIAVSRRPFWLYFW